MVLTRFSHVFLIFSHSLMISLAVPGTLGGWSWCNASAGESRNLASRRQEFPQFLTTSHLESIKVHLKMKGKWCWWCCAMPLEGSGNWNWMRWSIGPWVSVQFLLICRSPKATLEHAQIHMSRTFRWLIRAAWQAQLLTCVHSTGNIQIG